MEGGMSQPNRGKATNGSRLLCGRRKWDGNMKNPKVWRRRRRKTKFRRRRRRKKEKIGAEGADGVGWGGQCGGLMGLDEIYWVLLQSHQDL